MLEKTIKITRVLMIFSFIITIFFTYNQYQQMCNNQQVYQGVEVVYSKDLYKVCGSKFSIVNRGEGPINVETRTVEGGEATPETIVENSSLSEDNVLQPGQSIPVAPYKGTVYIIDNQIGSNLEHTIALQKTS